MSKNIGSERVMKRAGMTLEGTIRKGMLMKGIHRDLRLYSILKEEFVD
ncbi:GNAT family N-acetyltransferase [Priestia koreensis]|nr:GNAT family protein [Priestia koreensis]UNL83081.1 GNAT family N-acetyltransferase [Priestia koreensis]